MNDAETSAGLAATPGYRYADVEGPQLFVAGQVPLDGTGRLAGHGDPATQARVCLDNLRAVLAVHDFAVDDVRRLVVYVVGDGDALGTTWGAVRDWFGGEVPPATLLGVARLGYEHQLVEIDATVVRRTGE